jgi:hypothetical protein
LKPSRGTLLALSGTLTAIAGFRRAFSCWPSQRRSGVLAPCRSQLRSIEERWARLGTRCELTRTQPAGPSRRSTRSLNRAAQYCGRWECDGNCSITARHPRARERRLWLIIFVEPELVLRLKASQSLTVTSNSVRAASHRDDLHRRGVGFCVERREPHKSGAESPMQYKQDAGRYITIEYMHRSSTLDGVDDTFEPTLHRSREG